MRRREPFLASPGISRRSFLGNTAKLGIGAAGLSLAAHHASGSALAQEAEISMMGWGSPLEKENVDNGVQTFEGDHPDISVEWIHVPEDYATKLQTALAGGTPPDVFWSTNPRDYIARGVVMDVTSQIQADATLGAPDYFIQPQEQDRCTVNEKWYGIGSCWVMPHLYYNADLLEQAGVEPPSSDPANAWTWEHFLDVGRQLTVDSSGNHPDQDGFNAEDIQQWGIFWPTDFIHREALVFSNSGATYTVDHTTTLGEPAAVEAIQMQADLTNVHHVAPRAAVVTQMGMDAWQMLASGRVAILIDGSWALQDISKMGFAFGCGVLPMVKEAVSPALAHLHVIHAETDQPEAAWELLAYLSSDDYQRGLCEVGLWLPSHTSLLSPDGLATWMNDEVHPEGYDLIATKYLLENSRAIFYPAGFLECDQLITTALDPVWIGEQTAEQALVESGVVDQISEILAENKARLDENA
ncbi:MAG: ABC transporter substrate-binding protein [Thermomicrobiales bacterium]